MRLGYPVVFALMAFTWLGCMKSATNKKLVERASFDFNCPPANIQVVELDSRTRGVRACGQQATYVESCDGPKDVIATKCTWVQNTDSRPADR